MVAPTRLSPPAIAITPARGSSRSPRRAGTYALRTSSDSSALTSVLFRLPSLVQAAFSIARIDAGSMVAERQSDQFAGDQRGAAPKQAVSWPSFEEVDALHKRNLRLPDPHSAAQRRLSSSATNS